MALNVSFDASRGLQETHAHVRRLFGAYAAGVVRRRRSRAGYVDEIVRRCRFYVEPGSRVLELGVGTGDLLASLNARRAVGVDICPEMLELARSNHPELELYELAAEEAARRLEGPFDYILLSDLTVYLYDILALLRGLDSLCHSRTRLIINFHSRAWEPLLSLLAAFGLHDSHHARTNWITREDLSNLLKLAGFEVIKQDASTLLPMEVPGLSRLANGYLARVPGLHHGCLVNWVVARPRRALPSRQELRVSVICPCRNEEGNIKQIVDRLPPLGRETELVFVEGGSSDDTWAAITAELQAQRRPQLSITACRQDGKGKGDAVRKGFAHATGDVLVILDADLTVPPEDLPEFIDALASGVGEFINGSRLVYPMNEGAMRFLNVLGNKFFAEVFSWLLDQPLKDTLCGTKVLTRSDYERLARGRGYFGEFDPFGDFDLLFGAVKLNLHIVELPVRYRERRYGDTNIDRFRDGWLLLKMSWFAMQRLKFI